MRIDSPSVSVHLKARQILSLPDTAAGGISVNVKSGSVWLTEDNDRTDFVLESGQTHASRGRGQVVLYGLSEADVDIVEVAQH